MDFVASQQVVLEIPNSVEAYRGSLIQVDRQRCQLTARFEMLPPQLNLQQTVFLVVSIGETAHRVVAKVLSKSDTLLNLQLVSRFARNERRRAKRYPVSLSAMVQMETGSWQEVQVVDLSAYGAGLRLREPLKEGQQGKLILHLMSQDLPMAIAFEARYSRQEREGVWRVGVRFTEVARVDHLWLKRLFPSA